MSHGNDILELHICEDSGLRPANVLVSVFVPIFVLVISVTSTGIYIQLKVINFEYLSFSLQ